MGTGLKVACRFLSLSWETGSSKKVDVVKGINKIKLWVYTKSK